jgi:PAS domain S-box-containing protein
MLTALCLEDSPRDVEIMRELLTDAGFDLDMDSTAVESEFVSFLRDRTYDLILSDFKLPGFDAFAALRWSKEICPNVPFICVSGTVGEEIAIELLKQGAVDYILKDRLAKLPSAIKRALGDAKEREARQRAEEALRESQEFARRIIDSSNDCLKVLDLEGHLLSMSGGGQKLLEIDDIEPYLNRSWIDFWKGKDREGALEAISKAKKGDAGIFYGYCETAKGTPKWWEIIVSPIKDEQSNVVRLLALSRDITERKQTEEKTLRQLEELKRWQDVTLGREDRSRQLKREVNELLIRLGETIRYPSQESDEPKDQPNVAL